MAKFGYQILGFGSFTPAGGPGVWSDAGDTIKSARFTVQTSGNASAAIIAGGYNQTADSEIWNGSSFSDAVDNLSAAGHAAGGGGTSSSAIYIGGHRGSPVVTVCEKWDGSSWETADSLTTAAANMASAAEDKDNAWACGGYNPSASGGKVAKHEIMRSATWTVQGTDMLTPRYYLASNSCGSSGNGAAVAGTSAGSSRETKNEEYTYSSGSSGSWTTNTAKTTGLDENPGCFGQTSADDLVVFCGETASGPNGLTEEYSAGTWTTGNTYPQPARNNFGGGPTGNGLSVGGYREDGGGFIDEAYIFTRAIST